MKRAQHEPTQREQPAQSSARPRVLSIELAGARALASMAAWNGSTPEIDRVGRWSGSALATALLLEHALAHPGEPAPLVIAVGECVRRGVPTAARATIASRGPLTARLAEGAVGGDLARRLASRADALVLRGRAEGAGAVLVLERDGTVELAHFDELVGRSARETQAALERRFGECATLAIGPAGEREVPLASLTAGGDPPHFVGRGGLGAVLGRLGLKAMVVRDEPVHSETAAGLIDALLASPRLEQRARGGTLEQFGAFSARGDLSARNHSAPFDRDDAAQLEREVEAAREAKHGCAGCPTPCGWSFRSNSQRPQSARFGAAQALGLNLGLAHFDDALALLQRCDDLGLDAKEAGAALALAARARELGRADDAPRFGERAELLAALDGLAHGTGFGARLQRGPAAFAREVGLQHEHCEAKGASVRPDASLASLLGQCVSARGGDPMRTFAFLCVDGTPREVLQAITGLALPEGVQDPRSSIGKGRLVWWHENLAAALDTSGFCAFSAAALLADRVLTLDELALEIAPAELTGEVEFSTRPGDALLRQGAAVVGLQRELERHWAPEDQGARPEWARPRLDQPGMWDEYTRCRVGGAVPPTLERAPLEVEAISRATRATGRVTLRASGWLAREIGAETTHTLPLPAPWSEVAAAIAGELGQRGALLVRDGRPFAAAYRRGTALDENEPLHDGDALDLVLVVAGG